MTQRSFIDQMQRKVDLPHYPPRRIISLVPSQTELLFDLGLDESVVGITKFCVHPAEQFQRKTRVGGTKQYKMDIIEQLQPDLIIGNKEENDQAQIEALAARYPVWMSDISTIEDAFAMINSIGQLVDRVSPAKTLVQKIQTGFTALAKELKDTPTRRAAYFIWRKPYMVAGGDTFIDKMMQLAGFENVFSQDPRYPEISLEELTKRAVDFVLLSSEPYPFQEKHWSEFQTYCPNAVIKLIDGEIFSWYGSRLLHSAPYLLNLHKEITNDEPRS
ncbi:MAG: helical backbone metal receptor [Saprospiraceae bacterium]